MRKGYLCSVRISTKYSLKEETTAPQGASWKTSFSPSTPNEYLQSQKRSESRGIPRCSQKDAGSPCATAPTGVYLAWVKVRWAQQSPRNCLHPGLVKNGCPWIQHSIFSRELAGDVVTLAHWFAGLFLTVLVCGKYPLMPSGWQIAPKWLRKMFFVPYCEFPLSSGLFLKQTNTKTPPKPQKPTSGKYVRMVHIYYALEFLQ